MGNAGDKNRNALERNWKQVGSNCYRNLITDELIDCHHLTAHS